MNLTRQLIHRSLRFYARGHLGTLLGVTVATTVLVGALAVGDCVRGSLRDTALARLGRTSAALVGRDRLFREALADDLRPGVSNGLAAAVLQLPGTAASSDGSHRANHAQILGVDDHFWALAPTRPALPPDWQDGVLLNAALAQQLGAKTGDTILLRAQKPSLLSLEAPISPQEDLASGFRLTVKGILSDAEFGRFGLQANQIPPLNAFIPIHFLQHAVGLAGKANLLLAGGDQATAHLNELLRQRWTLADAQCELRETPGGLELRSERVFLDPPIVAALASPPLAQPELILTYFVNVLRAGTKTTPYSMVTAASAPLVPPDLRDDEILINPWLAEDLQAGPGDTVDLTYYIPGTTRRMEERTNRFTIRGILPANGPANDRTLLPDFPGIAKAESTANWDAGFPIDLGKIRPKDEKYWKDFRGTPKALVTLAAGQRMWGNRFGQLTAARFSSGPTAAAVAQVLLSNLNPASVGLAFLPIRDQALAAAEQAQDFGSLFLSFSFFLIVAALMLLALLFQFGLEKRAKETGLLLAVGWRPNQVRRLLLAEGMVVAVVGGVLGLGGGIFYAKGILWGLQTLWSAAVAHSSLQFHITAATLAGGGAASVFIGAGVIWFAIGGQTRRPARELLEQGNEMEIRTARPGRAWAGWLAAASFLAAIALTAWAWGRRGESAAAAFFGSGSLLLTAGLAAARVALRRLATESDSQRLTLGTLALRAATRRPARSLTIAALLACGAFLIIAVEANKLDARQEANTAASGTGGFALVGESALPVMQDLNTKAGLDFFGIQAKVMVHAAVLGLRVRDGDDASCLNLNRAQMPRLLGVKPNALDDRHAFTFADLALVSLAAHPWTALQKGTNSDPDEIPAIGDEASITWALGKKIGDTVDYTDEHGHPFKVRLVGALANSILQGSLLIDEAEFVKRFPGESGYRLFLVDAPPDESDAVSAALSRALQDRGLELSRAADRLNDFNAVQNTYLNTFQVLGSLGLILGSAGLGVVVLRNTLERRGELAVMEAVGYRRRSLRWLVICEHGVLQLLGLILGLVAALLAVLPVLLSPGGQISFGPLALTLCLVLASGLLWTWAAARVSLRGDLLDALREE